MLEYEIEVLTQAASEEFVPVYGSTLAAGADVKACISEDVLLLPGESTLIPTGLKVEIPQGYEIQVRPRSGLAFKHQITVLNTPGTIDADYRGEIGVILINHGKEPFRITRGMRIAQIVLSAVLRASFSCKERELSMTARGEGGFGHTGTH
ncbi:MAG: dUTP diphosphatase [Rhabdochlamydiaceae bacterium]|nr:dUTP diphosphatase [Rhabdochlamydiaceae bacterium]